MMYCKDCERFFDDDQATISVNTVPYGATHVVESIERECPYCSSNDLLYDVTKVTCDKCGKSIPDEEVYQNDDGDNLCLDCLLLEQE